MYRDNDAEDRSVLVVGLRGAVFGVDPATGKHIWEHRLPEGYQEVELIVHGGRVFASNGFTLLCLEYPSGRLLREVDVPGSYNGRCTMVLERGRLYVATRGELACFDPDDGRLLWEDPYTGKGVGSMSLGFPDNVRQADDRGNR